MEGSGQILPNFIILSGLKCPIHGKRLRLRLKPKATSVLGREDLTKIKRQEVKNKGWKTAIPGNSLQEKENCRNKNF